MKLLNQKLAVATISLVIAVFYFSSLVFAQTASSSPIGQSSVSLAPSTQPIAGTVDNNGSQSLSIDNQQPPATTLTADQEGVKNLPTPLLLPDSPFYFIKRWGENIRTFITIDDYQKAQLELQFAQNRLAEAQAELKKNNTKLSDQMLSDYNKDLERVNQATAHLTEEGKDVTHLIDGIKDHEQKRLAILDQRLAKTTDPNQRQQIQSQIKQITNQSQTNINRLVNALVKKNPQASPYRNVTGQVTSVSSPNFTIQQGDKSITFTTDSTTQFRKYGSKDSATFSDISVGSYVSVTVLKNPVSGNSGTSSASPNQILLARTVVVNIPQTMIKPLNGTIANFSQSNFTLNTESGAFTVNVNNDTQWRSNRKDLDNPLSYIKSGVHVRVYAVLQNDNSYLAKTVVLLLAKRQVRNGTITSIGSSSIIIHANNNQDYTFNLSGQTIIRKGKNPASSADLTVGERVRVGFDGVEGTQSGDASEIVILNNQQGGNKPANTNPTPSGSTTSAVPLASPVASPK